MPFIVRPADRLRSLVKPFAAHLCRVPPGLWTACAIIAVSPARAQDLTEPTRDPLAIRVEPLLVYFTPGGRIIFPGTTQTSKDIDVEALNLDSPRLSPGIELEASLDRWRLQASTIHFEQNDREAASPVGRPVGDITLSKGDAIVSSLRFDWAQIAVGRTLLDRTVGPEDELNVQLSVAGGVRYYDLSMSVERAAGGRASADPTFLEPIALADARFTYNDRYALRVETSIGYSDFSGTSTQSWSLTLAMAWRLADWADLEGGYRILSFDLDQGQGVSAFEYRGSMAGLYAGLSMRF